MKSPARQGLDRLLAALPDRDVYTVVNQTEDDVGPWTLVDLVVDERTVEKFAIWNTTGAVYRYDVEHPGAVEDDPFLTIEEKPDDH